MALKGRGFRQWVYFLSIVLGVYLLITVFSPPRAHADSEALKEFGDAMQIVLPGLAIGSTFIAGSPDGSWWDKEGTYQSIKTIGTTMIATSVWKRAAGKLRPDFGSTSSFPSGHTSAVFSSAAFINTRYGWKWGVPAYTLALITG